MCVSPEVCFGKTDRAPQRTAPVPHFPRFRSPVCEVSANLAPAGALTTSPDDPEPISDPAYAAEVTRRLPISGARPDLLSHLVTERRRYR